MKPRPHLSQFILNKFAPRFLKIGVLVLSAVLVLKIISTRARYGVTQNDVGKVQPGLNLIFYSHEQAAYLLDLNGQIKYQWANPLSDFYISPQDNQCYHPKFNYPWPQWRCGWQAVRPAPKNGLYIISGTEALAYLDQESKVVWALRGSFHSDLDLDESGNIFTITKDYSYYRYQGKRHLIAEEFLTKISPDGRILSRISMLDMLSKHQLLDNRQGFSIFRLGEKQESIEPISEETRNLKDLLHFNALNVLKKNISSVGNRGDILLSFRNLDLIVIFDLHTRRVKWFWGPGELLGQHNLTSLSNGNFLVFDNRDKTPSSRVVELDPENKSIVWQFPTSRNEDKFFSAVKGGAQRLENGNTLITASHQGRIFEVTPEGQTVWNFQAPSGIVIVRATRLERKRE